MIVASLRNNQNPIVLHDTPVVLADLQAVVCAVVLITGQPYKNKGYKAFGRLILSTTQLT
jgi:hypothetical protein